MSSAVEGSRRGRGADEVLAEVGRSLRGALAVVIEAGRLLLAHWPVLLLVLLLGAAGREAVLWATVLVSRWSPTASTLVMPLAPLCTVLALIVALRVVIPSMRNVDSEGVGRSRGLSILTGALIPFLAVYAAQGYLREDTRRYLNETAYDEELLTNPFAGDTYDGRTWAEAPLWLSISIVVLALVLRWGLDRSRLAERHAALGLLAGWVETLWLVTIATSLQSDWAAVWAWVQERQGVAWLLDGWAWVVGVLGPIGAALDGAVAWLWATLGDFDTLVVVPMAWLTVGAVVYGRELGDPSRPVSVREAVIGSIEDERTRRAVERARERVRRAQARTAWLPASLRAWLTEPITSVTGRFRSLGRGLLTLIRAGLVPMVTLCLALVLAQHAAVGAAYALRAILGPQDVNAAVQLSTRPGLLFSVLSTLLMVVLIAAAVDRFLVRAQGGSRDVHPAPLR